ncbi:MAG: universal stress protein [Anaerolineae bacterium]
MMGRILCATRGGEPSHRTQDEAIELAKERDDTLLFLYVVDPEFLGRMAEANVLNTEQELARVGRRLLLLATDRTADQGVAAETIIRTGEMREEVKDTAHKEVVSSGRSARRAGAAAGEESVFELADLEAIAGEIEDGVGVETRII